MKYKSTRGGVSGVPFKDAVMMGLATDGGLLIPEFFPPVAHRLGSLRDLSYTELATEIMGLFIDDISEAELAGLVERSYRSFDDPLVTPLIRVGDIHVLELFHGPTLAFKDIALQFLGELFDHILQERGEQLNILGATSGDTGSAAIAGVRGRDNMRMFIMYPEGRTSALQERQMTTVLDDNVHNIAIQGSFDDCQRILKSIFSDLPYKHDLSLGAVNSVNWARVLAQVVYYFSAYFQLDPAGEFDVCIPTGNFGNIFAAYIAQQMGLPINKLVLATNENDILSRFFKSGVYERGEVRHSVSPAMDIQVSSNFERYLFFQLGEAAEKLVDFMTTFERFGRSEVHYNTAQFDRRFLAGSASDEETLKQITRYHREYGYLADPHTAVGLHVASGLSESSRPLVAVATAHPAKFPEVIESAVPELEVTHPSISELMDLPTRSTSLEADTEVVKAFIRRMAETG